MTDAISPIKTGLRDVDVRERGVVCRHAVSPDKDLHVPEPVRTQDDEQARVACRVNAKLFWVSRAFSATRSSRSMSDMLEGRL